MIGQAFHTVVNKNDMVGIRCNYKPAVTMICYRSPYATAKHNIWLERKLLRLYNIYYHKVLLESTGRFWHEKEPAITANYASFYGGEALNDDKNEKR